MCKMLQKHKMQTLLSNTYIQCMFQWFLIHEICVFLFSRFSSSSAPSQHDAQLLAIGHQPDLFRLAVDQRYAHEYGDSCVTEDFALAATACSRSCRFSEASFSQGQSPEKQPRHTADWQNPQKTQLSQSDLELRSADCMETQSEKDPVQALNLKMYDSHTQYFPYFVGIYYLFVEIISHDLKVHLISAKGNQNKAHL